MDAGPLNGDALLERVGSRNRPGRLQAGKPSHISRRDGKASELGVAPEPAGTLADPRIMTAIPQPITLALCVPSTDIVMADFAMSLAVMSRTTVLPLIFINTKAPVAHAYNMMIEEAFKREATHVLFLEYDQTFPANTALRLLSHKKDIVGATYVKRTPPYPTLGSSLAPFRGNDGLVEMSFMPQGVMLARMDVFKKIPRPWFHFPVNDEGELGTQDVWFCNAARKAGFQIWCDVALSLQVGHIGQAVHFIPSDLDPVETANAA